MIPLRLQVDRMPRMKEVKPLSTELWRAPRGGKVAMSQRADEFCIVSFLTEEEIEMLV